MMMDFRDNKDEPWWAVSIDIETTGLDPDRHQVLEVAAVAYDLRNPPPWDDTDSLEMYPHRFEELLVPEEVMIGPFALHMHQESGLLEEWRNPSIPGAHLRNGRGGAMWTITYLKGN